MSKNKPNASGAKPADKTDAKPKKNVSDGKALRETIESVVIAFVLAFLFRTFEAEAFVIPTGSMAPTLQGRHLDVECPECGFRYRVGSSVDEKKSPAQQVDAEVMAATCPLCRYVMSVAPGTREGNDNPPYNGDRILVAKFPYDFHEPDRWDVFVFKFPGDAKMNYIKRLVGLPNESLRIHHGDISTKPYQAPDAEYQITRKPPHKLLAMLQTVYENDYVVDEMTDAGWPLRWSSAAESEAPAWTTKDKGRSYAVAGKEGEISWLRYQHIVPSPLNWRDGKLDVQFWPPRPQLITDFYAYNDYVTREGPQQNHALGPNWVGDLKVDCELDVQKAAGSVVFELIKGGRHFRATLDPATGKAALSIDGVEAFHPEAQTSLRGVGRYQVGFANVDEQLLLWIDGKLVEFNGPTTYAPLGNDIPTADDLAPVGIGVNGTDIKVEHLNLWRDIYYIAGLGDFDTSQGGVPTNLDFSSQLPAFLNFFSDPRLWPAQDGTPSPFDARRTLTYDIGPDKFIALGDNSPMSADSRLWLGGPFVDRELLIGKAVFIYWPHYWPAKHHINVLPLFPRLHFFEFPFWPNFRRMGFVR